MTTRGVVLTLVACSTSVAGAGAVWWYRPGRPAAEPVPSPLQILVTPTEVDFGTLFQGEVVVRRVTVENPGPADYAVEQVIPSCGCSGAEVSSPDLARGRAVTLTVRFNSAGKAGAQRHAVRLLCRAADTGRLEEVAVPVRVEVRALAYLVADTVDFGDCALGGTYRATATVTCAPGHAGAGPPLLGVPAGADAGEFRLVPRGPLGEGPNELTLEYTPRLRAGRRGATLDLHTGLAGYPPLRLA